MKKLLFLFLVSIFACTNEEPETKTSPDLKREVEEVSEPKICSYRRLNDRVDTMELYRNSAKIEIRSYKVTYTGFIPDEAEEEDLINNKKPEKEKVDLVDRYEESIVLNAEQKDSLFQLITGYESDCDPIGADCFWPRHRISFHTKENTLIGTIDICFECSMIQASISEFNYLSDDMLTRFESYLKWCGINKGFDN